MIAFLLFVFLSQIESLREKRMAGGLSDIDVPYLVNILWSNKTQKCTGAKIHKNYVLTAAQCGDDGIIVVAGGAETKAKKIHCHDKYEKGMVSKYDLAIIEVDVADSVSILELSNDPWPQNGTSQSSGLDCTTAGFGSDKADVPSESKLKSLSVKAIHGDHACGCLRSFQNRRVVCLNEQNRGLCQGDMGAPLVCDGKAVGVGHFRYQQKNCEKYNVGFNSLKCGETQSVYMFICPHLDWINKIIPSIPKSPESCSASKIKPKIILIVIFIKIMQK